MKIFIFIVKEMHIIALLISLSLFIFFATEQKEFMKQIQSSGVLIVFSQAWIEELYHQVLDRNMLGESGYWGIPEGHCLPLITILISK